MIQKPIIKRYPEFALHYTTWQNQPAPPIDEKLVKELASIAKTPEGRPCFRVRWAADCYERIPDELEINENGLTVGIEKGGEYHDDPAALFDIISGYQYKDENGKTVWLEFGKATDAPDGVILEEVWETRSYGVPRWRVEEWKDWRNGEAFASGGYFTRWYVEELVAKGENKEGDAIEIVSNYRPFSRYDVEQAKNLYNEQIRLSFDEKARMMEEDRLAELKRKTDAIMERRANNEAMIDKFFRDKEYRQMA